MSFPDVNPKPKVDPPDWWELDEDYEDG